MPPSMVSEILQIPMLWVSYGDAAISATCYQMSSLNLVRTHRRLLLLIHEVFSMRIWYGWLHDRRDEFSQASPMYVQFTLDCQLFPA